MSIVILDNGGGTVKAGVIGKDSSIARCHTSPPVIVPNATAKPGSSSNSNSTSLVGDQISQFYQSSNGGTYLHFMRSFERFMASLLFSFSQPSEKCNNDTVFIFINQ